MKVYILEFPNGQGLYLLEGVFASYESARDYCKHKFSLIPRSEYKRPMDFVENHEGFFTYFSDASCFYLGSYRGYWEDVKE